MGAGLPLPHSDIIDPDGFDETGPYTVLFNLEGRLRKTQVPVTRPLLPVFEAVANAVHAIQEARRDDGVVTVEIRRGSLLDGSEQGPIEDVLVTDNGIGFTDQNFSSFETADTTYKLPIGGKGVGRFTWLVAFEAASVESRYGAGAASLRRNFEFTRAGITQAPERDPALLPGVGTRVLLSGFRSPWRDRCPRDAELIAADLIEHFIALFVTSSTPALFLIDGGVRLDLRAEFARMYDQAGARREFEVGGDLFTFTGLRLRRAQGGRSHRVLYLADGREVRTEGLASHLPGLPNPLRDERGAFHFVGFVQGAALDKSVDADRSSFRLPEQEDEANPSLLRQLTWRDLRGGALGIARVDLSPWLDEIDREKRARLEAFVERQEPHYKVLLSDVDQILPHLPAEPKPADIDRALSRRLFERRETLKAESDKLLSEMEKVEQVDPDAYRERMEKAVREHNELGIADLARYVCHRRVILELFDRALRLQPGTGKYGREDAVHSLVHPMRKTSLNTDYYGHNLWLLDERLAYSWRVYSDVPLSAIDIAEIPSGKEPDLLIFDRPIILGGEEEPLTAATLVEFKRPGRTDYGKDRVITQVYNYLDRLRGGTFKDFEGRPVRLAEQVPVTVYVVADFTPALEQDLRDANMKRTPDTNGFYVFNDDRKAYIEVLSYQKMLDSARRRNRPFFNVLGLSTVPRG